MACRLAELVSPTAVRIERDPSTTHCSSLHINAETAYPFTVGMSAISRALASPHTVRISTLELRNMPLDAHSLHALARVLHCRQRIRTLILHHNAMRPADASALAQLLDVVRSIRSLRIVSNSLGDDGGRALEAALRMRRRVAVPLQTLELTDVGLGSLGMRRLLAAAIGGANRSSDGGATCLNLTLATRDPGTTQATTAPIVRALRHALVDVDAMAAGRAVAPRAHAARRHGNGGLLLGLGSNRIGDRGTVRLSALLLRAFGRELTSGPTSNVVLRGLDLRDNHIGDEGAAALAAAVSRLPNLARLDAGTNPVGAAGFVALLAMAPSHPSLVSLRLPPGLGRATETPKSQPSSWPAALEGRAVAALTALGGSALQELHVPRWDVLGPRAVATVVDALRRGSRLTALDLHESSLPLHVAHSLADVLAQPSCRLRSLRLTSNALPVRTVVRLASALANNTHLRTLDLSNNNVGAMGARALLASATASGALIEVTYVNAGVGGKWHHALQQALRRNKQRWRLS